MSRSRLAAAATGRLLKASLLISALLLTVDLAAGAQPGHAQTSIRISRLDCTSDPEVVQITNTGSQSQDLTGWKLQSDPVDSESFDLTPVGVLPPGGSIFVESGPSAAAVFTWTHDFIFRDGFPTDFARLVDSQGQQRDQVACSPAPGSGTPTASPTPSPAPSPQPTATPASAIEQQVPNGGGLPPHSGHLLSPLALLSVGASLIVGGAGALLAASIGGTMRSWKRRNRGRPPAITQGAAPSRTPISGASEADSRPLLLAIVIALVAAALVAFLVQSESSRRR